MIRYCFSLIILIKVKKFNSTLCWSGCGRLEFLGMLLVKMYYLFGEHLVKNNHNCLQIP